MPNPTDQKQLLTFFAASFADDLSLLAGGTTADVSLSSADPIAINDLNGEPLFLDFSIVDSSGNQLGIIRSSAQGEALPIIDSIALGPQYFDPDTAISAAVTQSASDLSGSTVQSASLVCYGYPRIGVLVVCAQNGQIWSLVYDAVAVVLVNKWQGTGAPAPAEAGPLQQPIDGIPFYSYLDQVRGNLPEGAVSFVSQANSQWAGLRNAATSAAGEAVPAGTTVSFSIRAAAAAQPPKARVALRGTLLPARAIGQQTEVYCAVAAVEMILDFLGIGNFTQDQIAKALGTTAVGTTNSGMVAGISQLSHGQWTAKVITNPTFQQNVNVVEALIPAKSAIPGHARLLRGWREYCFFDSSGNVAHREQFYIVNDPYPTNKGQLTLENATTPIPNFYTNSLYLLKAGSSAAVSGSGGGAASEGGVSALPLGTGPARSFGAIGTVSTKVLNSRTFEIQLPAGVRVQPGEPVPPEVLDFIAAMLRAKG